MIEYFILAAIGGILIGYGGHNLIWKLKNRIVSELYCFWHYKILKEPEPNITDVVSGLIPTIFAAAVSMELAKEMQDVYAKSIAKSKLKQKNLVKR